MFRWKRAAAVAVVVGLGLTACSGSTGKGSGGASGSTSVVLASIVGPTSYAANGAGWANESALQQAVYDTLLHADPDGKVVPWLATSWTYSADKKTLTFKLRDDVKFTDGTKFDADAAAKNMIRFRDGTAPNKSFLANVADATAVDATTLKVTLSQPDPALLTYLTQAAGLEESPKHFGAANEKTVPVGSGPYVLDTGKTVVGSSYVYTANPDYFAKSQQHWKNLTIKVLTTTPTQVNAIKGGQIDGVNLIDNTALKQVSAAGYTLVPHELDWVGIALFDRNGKIAPALKDVRVRQAINYAIDRDAMVKAVAQGNGTKTGQIFPTSSPGYDASLDDKYPYDPAKAKALLKEAGYSKFTLNLPQVPGFLQVASDLTKQYLGAVGITVKYTTVPINNIIADILAAKYPAAIFILQEDPTAYQESTFILTGSSTFNVFHQADPKVESLVKTIQTGSQSESDAATKTLNAYVVDQAWFNPWYRNQGNFATSKNITAKAQVGNAYPYLYSITPKG